VKTLFAVTRTRGPAWDASRPLRSQDQWNEHALFMDQLETERIVLLGGPLGTGNDFLLIFDAASEHSIRTILDRDPWTPMKLLDTKRIEPWTILLNSVL
jgi:uncharacterized protein YciI